MKEGFKKIFSIIITFIASHICSSLIMKFIKIDYVSQLDLSIYSAIISLLVSIFVAILIDSNIYICFELKMKYAVLGFIFIIVLSLTALLSRFAYKDCYYLAFSNWDKISLDQIFISLLLIVSIFYAPSAILEKFLKSNLTFIEKITFYPAFSSVLLIFLGIITTYFKTNIIIFLFFIFISFLLIASLIYEYRSSSGGKVVIHINILEILGILSAILFNLFIFYTAIGESSAFIRGDMWGDTHRVAVLAKYGLRGYLESPVEGYPPFYAFLWFTISNILPLPFINSIIIIAFLNHVLSVIAFYVLAKNLYKDHRSALLTIILWNALSGGFAWSYLIFNPPLGKLSGKQLLDYIDKVSIYFGKYSGTIVSPIYADGHALTRLWSLYLFFTALALLIRTSNFNVQNRGYELIIFLSSYAQILLGHITEVPLIAIALFILFISNVFDNKFAVKLLISLTFISTLGFIVLKIITSFSLMITFLISYVSVVAILFSSMSSIIYKRASICFTNSKFNKRNIGYVLRFIFAIIFLQTYGLMWIAIFLKYPFYINWAIATLWYSPAIEWGFLGLLAILALTKLGLKRDNWDLGFKFVLCYFILQCLLLAVLNYVNYNYSYITTPYPFQPILFLPILALISSRFFITKNSFVRTSRKIIISLTIIFLMLIFSLGSLGHILSASYWKVNNGWWLNKPLNPSEEDIQLINFLYKYPTNSPFEFVGTLYDWSNPSSYVVYPSGVAVLSEALIDILAHTNDPQEIYILSKVFYVNFILVPSNLSNFEGSYISTIISKVKPVFENGKYKLYSIKSLNLTETELPNSRDFITISKIVFYGNLIVRDTQNSSISFSNVKGEIYPLNKGRVILNVNISENILLLVKPYIYINGNITLIDMKSTWRYFSEIKSSAKKLVIIGSVSFNIFNSFKERIYLENFNYSGKYEAYPFPLYLSPDYARNQIDRYYQVNNIDVFNVISSSPGIIWTVAVVLSSVYLCLRRVYAIKVRVKVRIEKCPRNVPKTSFRS